MSHSLRPGWAPGQRVMAVTGEGGQALVCFGSGPSSLLPPERMNLTFSESQKEETLHDSEEIETASSGELQRPKGEACPGSRGLPNPASVLTSWGCRRGVVPPHLFPDLQAAGHTPLGTPSLSPPNLCLFMILASSTCPSNVLRHTCSSKQGR